MQIGKRLAGRNPSLVPRLADCVSQWMFQQEPRLPGSGRRAGCPRIAGPARFYRYDFARHAGSGQWFDRAVVVADGEKVLPHQSLNWPAAHLLRITWEVKHHTTTRCAAPLGWGSASAPNCCRDWPPSTTASWSVLRHCRRALRKVGREAAWRRTGAVGIFVCRPMGQAISTASSSLSRRP